LRLDAKVLAGDGAAVGRVARLKMRVLLLALLGGAVPVGLLIVVVSLEVA